jgi:2-succinyl-6-hydroxy-2,4-cyclohexadiene-1-carboxylate synthase
MIHFISGLFCGTEIWDPYLQIGNGRRYDLHHLPKDITSEDVVVGYSMGGRIALKLASDFNFGLKRLILLSAHPGIEEDEKPERKKWEDEILKKMDTLGSAEFLKFWDTQGLFNQSQVNKDISQEDFKANRGFFDQYRLSEQKNFLKEMIKHKDKITYIYGKDDEKYSEIANKLSSHSIRCIEINADHRVYLKPESLLPILKRELVI